MGFEHILVDRSGDFVTITMNRPERRNALSWRHMHELITAFRETAGELTRQATVLAGDGPAFWPGHDFADVASRPICRRPLAAGHVHEVMTAMQEVPQVVSRGPRARHRGRLPARRHADRRGSEDGVLRARPAAGAGWFCHTRRCQSPGTSAANG